MGQGMPTPKTKTKPKLEANQTRMQFCSIGRCIGTAKSAPKRFKHNRMHASFSLVLLLFLHVGTPYARIVFTGVG